VILGDKAFILVTGATGAVGPRVVAALCEEGYDVRTLSLDTPPPGIWPEGVRDIRMGDINDRAAIGSAVQGIDAVIHMAALLHILNPSPEIRHQYERINVDGTANVVEAARQAGVGRLVFFSTIAVYGASAGGILTEDSPLHPDSFYAQTKVDAERIVLTAKRVDGTPLGTVLRLGAVYGARIKGNYRRLLLALARGRFLPIGPGTNRRTLVYDRDAARAAVVAATNDTAAGKVFNVSDGRFHSMNEIIDTICNALGRKPPEFTLPFSPVRRVAGILEDGAGLFGLQSPVTRDTIDKYSEDIAVDGLRIQKELGFIPHYDLSAGWKETVQEMRRMNSL